jgi:SAM-dependent methyltransferase
MRWSLNDFNLRSRGKDWMQEYSVFADRERAGWSDEEIVDAYVSRFGPITDEVGKVLSDRVAEPGQSVLDLCCGQGSLTAVMSAAGAAVAGLDFSPTMLAIAAKAAPEASLHEGDATAMPFADESFDAVVCNFGMMHIPDQPKALSEICRVLRPDGQFLMATWVGPETSPAFATVLGAVKALADMSTAPAQPDLFAFARLEVANEMMAGAGLNMTAHEMVTPAWELDEPNELFEIFLTATVGAAMLIKSQAPETIGSIRDRVTETVAQKFAAGSGYRVPVPVAVVTAIPA